MDYLDALVTLRKRVYFWMLAMTLIGVFSIFLVRYSSEQGLDVLVITDTYPLARVGRVFRAALAEELGRVHGIVVDVVESSPPLDVTAAGWALVDVVKPFGLDYINPSGGTRSGWWQPVFRAGGVSAVTVVLVNPGGRTGSLRVIRLRNGSSTQLIVGVDNGTLEVIGEYLVTVLSTMGQERDVAEGKAGIDSLETAISADTCTLASSLSVADGEQLIETAAKAVAKVTQENGLLRDADVIRSECCMPVQRWIGELRNGVSSDCTRSLEVRKSENRSSLNIVRMGPTRTTDRNVRIVSCHEPTGNCRTNYYIGRDSFLGRAGVSQGGGGARLDGCIRTGVARFELDCNTESASNGEHMSRANYVEAQVCLRTNYAHEGLIVIRDSLGFARLALNRRSFADYLKTAVSEISCKGGVGSRRDADIRNVLVSFQFDD